jgi:hypothetical protein
MEHMAVVLYGQYASGDLSRQYYVPVQNSRGGWDWAVNGPGTPRGVDYADYVFSHQR